mmetsp:Transcript_39488/g.91182  ORF Transcript_39488/g.91182 Transcript_39488/m.91182 type:complete len:233 (+) Transcript_39488:115-813(+)
MGLCCGRHFCLRDELAACHQPLLEPLGRTIHVVQRLLSCEGHMLDVAVAMAVLPLVALHVCPAAAREASADQEVFGEALQSLHVCVVKATVLALAPATNHKFDCAAPIAVSVDQAHVYVSTKSFMVKVKIFIIITIEMHEHVEGVLAHGCCLCMQSGFHGDKRARFLIEPSRHLRHRGLHCLQLGLTRIQHVLQSIELRSNMHNMHDGVQGSHSKCHRHEEDANRLPFHNDT